jgi:hypothetical protein
MNRTIGRNLLANAGFPPEDHSLSLTSFACKKVMKTDTITFGQHFGLRKAKAKEPLTKASPLDKSPLLR